jgi:tetratricopeptide (TPR) repeat protein
LPRFCLAVGLLSAALARAETDPVILERDLNAYLVAEHHKLAERCVAEGLLEEARAEFAAVLRVKPGDAAAKAMMAGGGATWILEWTDELHAKYLAYREDRRLLDYEASSRYLALGQAKAAKGGTDASRAAFRRALEYDADYEEARAALGEAKVEGAGWLPAAEADKRSRGLLPIGGKWLPADEVRARRKVWGEAWEVAGAHFVVRSNHSEEGAREALQWAEEMYHALQRETAPVFAPPKDEKPMKVYLFATREDFRAHEKDAHPGRIGDGAVGFYSSEDRAAHFWHGQDTPFSPLRQVVRHECCHEVLDHWIPWKDLCTDRPHFWIVEGVARFFETTRARDGKVLVGDVNSMSVKTARRMATKGQALTLAEMAALRQDGMPGHYEEASAMTHFFMLADGGKMRETFLKYCSVVLRGEATADTFRKVFGKKESEYEVMWRGWLAELK